MRVGSFREHQPPSCNTIDIAMFKLKFFVVALFAVIVQAAAIGQFPRPLA